MVSRIHSLLKVLDPILSEDGGVRSLDDMVRVVSLMKDMHKLETRCTYLNLVMQTQDSQVLHKFVVAGGWKLMNEWLAEVKQFSVDDTLFLEEVLKALVHLPVTIDVLKQNTTPKLIKNLTKDPDMSSTIHELAAKVVEQWLHVIKGNTTPFNDVNSPDSQSCFESDKRSGKSSKDGTTKKKSKSHAPPSTGMRMTGLETTSQKSIKRLSSEFLENSESSLKKMKQDNGDSHTNGHSSEEKQKRREEKRKLRESQEEKRIKFIDLPEKTEKVQKDSKAHVPSRHDDIMSELGGKPKPPKDCATSQDEKSTAKPDNSVESKMAEKIEKMITASHSVPEVKKKAAPESQKMRSLSDEKKTKVMQVTGFADSLFKPAAPIVKKKVKPKVPGNKTEVKPGSSPIKSVTKSTDSLHKSSKSSLEETSLPVGSSDSNDNSKTDISHTTKTSEIKLEKNDGEELREETNISPVDSKLPNDDSCNTDEPMDIEQSPEEVKKELPPPGGIKGILVYHRSKKKNRRIQWKREEEICRVQYFEVDENERSNFRKTGFQDYAKQEMIREKMTMQRVKEGKEESIGAWILIPITDLPPGHYSRGSRSTEKEFQDKREIGVLAEIYFDVHTIPDSPRVPDPENFPKKDPIMIPWEETEMDLDASPGDKNTALPMPPSIPNKNDVVEVIDLESILKAEKLPPPIKSVVESPNSMANKNAGPVADLTNENENPPKTEASDHLIPGIDDCKQGLVENQNKKCDKQQTDPVALAKVQEVLKNFPQKISPTENSRPGFLGNPIKSEPAHGFVGSSPPNGMLSGPPPGLLSGPPPGLLSRPPPPGFFEQMARMCGPPPGYLNPTMPPTSGIGPAKGQDPRGLIQGPLAGGFPPGFMAGPPPGTRPPSGPGGFCGPPPGFQGSQPGPGFQGPPPGARFSSGPPPRFGGALPAAIRGGQMRLPSASSQCQTSQVQGPPTGPTGIDASMVCRFFAQGHCKSGTNCRFIHVPRGPPPVESAQVGSQDIDERQTRKPDNPHRDRDHRGSDNSHRDRDRRRDRDDDRPRKH